MTLIRRSRRSHTLAEGFSRAIVLAGLGASFLASFDLLIVVSALPSAARDVGDINNYALAAGAYSVASVVGMPLAGIVNDRIGPRFQGRLQRDVAADGMTDQTRRLVAQVSKPAVSPASKPAKRRRWCGRFCNRRSGRL